MSSGKNTHRYTHTKRMYNMRKKESQFKNQLEEMEKNSKVTTTKPKTAGQDFSLSSNNHWYV